MSPQCHCANSNEFVSFLWLILWQDVSLVQGCQVSWLMIYCCMYLPYFYFSKGSWTVILTVPQGRTSWTLLLLFISCQKLSVIVSASIKLLRLKVMWFIQSCSLLCRNKGAWNDKDYNSHMIQSRKMKWRSQQTAVYFNHTFGLMFFT